MNGTIGVRRGWRWPIKALKLCLSRSPGVVGALLCCVLLSGSVSAGAVEISAADIDALGEARDIYHANCAMCHGYDGIPILPGAPNFAKGERLDKPEAELLRSIAEGRATMPPWGKELNQHEQLAVLTYIRVIGGDGLFQDYCESCHSSSMPALSEAIPKGREKLSHYAGPWEFCHDSEVEHVVQREEIISLIRLLREIPKPTLKGQITGEKE